MYFRKENKNRIENKEKKQTIKNKTRGVKYTKGH